MSKKSINKLEKRILEISYRNKSAHLGSCLTAVGIIDKIYSKKGISDKFVLSNGHAFVALAVVLEKYEGRNAEDLTKRHGTHPTRNIKDGLWCSTGSLGMGITIAVGIALADRTKNVYVLMSDGEMAEGSCWEALMIAGEQKLDNLKVAVNVNGHSALGETNPQLLKLRIQSFFPSLVKRTNMNKYPGWLQGVPAHYVILDGKKYKEVMK
ncbi:MAG: hypothetical protein HW400_91 [Candidatus Levybacteria bacterium]|nr:hypothetical protein [Candidatus Levybacteria bacterium]